MYQDDDIGVSFNPSIATDILAIGVYTISLTAYANYPVSGFLTDDFAYGGGNPDPNFEPGTFMFSILGVTSAEFFEFCLIHPLNQFDQFKPTQHTKKNTSLSIRRRLQLNISPLSVSIL